MSRDSVKALESLFNEIPDLERDLYDLLTHKMKSPEGLNIKVGLGSLKFSSNKINFKSLLAELCCYVKSKHKTSSVPIPHSFIVKEELRGNLDSIPLCFDDKVEVSLKSGGSVLFVQKQEVCDFKDNFKVLSSPSFLNNALTSRQELILNIKLLHSGDSRIQLEEEMVNVSNVLLAEFEKSLQRIKRLSRSSLSPKNLQSRLALLGYQIPLEEVDSFYENFLKTTPSYHPLQQVSKDILSLSRMVKDFGKVVSTPDILEDSAETVYYRERISDMIEQLTQKEVVLDFSKHVLLDLSLGELKNL